MVLQVYYLHPNKNLIFLCIILMFYLRKITIFLNNICVTFEIVLDYFIFILITLHCIQNLQFPAKTKSTCEIVTYESCLSSL